MLWDLKLCGVIFDRMWWIKLNIRGGSYDNFKIIIFKGISEM